MSQKRKQVVKKCKSKAKVFKCTRTSYFIKQKEEVVNYAKEYERNNTIAYFNFNNSMVRY